MNDLDLFYVDVSDIKGLSLIDFNVDPVDYYYGDIYLQSNNIDVCFPFFF